MKDTQETVWRLGRSRMSNAHKDMVEKLLVLPKQVRYK